MKKNTISACMMGRNEEDCLDRCLESIKDVVDEIVFVDTGSTDKTIEIAKKYKARIIEEPWADDFSKHRNTGIQACTGEWIFIIDCDEELDPESASRFRDEILGLKQEGIVWMSVWNKYKVGNPTFLASVRLFKSEIGIRYSGIVHNRPGVPIDIFTHRSSMRINHYGYDLSPEKMEKKHERTKKLLEKRLKDEPNDSYALMHYAQLHRNKNGRFNVERAPGILSCSVKAFQLTDPMNLPGFHVYMQSLEMAAWAALYMQRLDDCVEWGMKAIAIKEDYLDAIMVTALGFQNMAKYKASTTWFNRYLAANDSYEPDKDISMLKMLYINRQSEAYYGIAHNSEMSGDVDKAINYYLLTLRAEPGKVGCYERLYRLYLRGELHEREWAMSKQLFSGYDNAEKGADYYDKLYADGYNADLKMEPIRHKAIDWLVTAIPGSVLELGCGTGKLGRELEKIGVGYLGIDFSEKAVNKAVELGTKQVKVASAYDPDLYDEYDCVVSLETIEHLEDMRVMEVIPLGKRVIFSVPSFTDPAHLREYPTAEYIKFRYRGILDIKTIQQFDSQIGKIFLCDATRVNQLKEKTDGTDFIKNKNRQQDCQLA